jgi:hypothetical protein
MRLVDTVADRARMGNTPSPETTGGRPELPHRVSPTQGAQGEPDHRVKSGRFSWARATPHVTGRRTRGSPRLVRHGACGRPSRVSSPDASLARLRRAPRADHRDRPRGSTSVPSVCIRPNARECQRVRLADRGVKGMCVLSPGPTMTAVAAGTSTHSSGTSVDWLRHDGVPPSLSCRTRSS